MESFLFCLNDESEDPFDQVSIIELVRRWTNGIELEKIEEKYGHIELWNTSQLTSMYKTFSKINYIKFNAY